MRAKIDVMKRLLVSLLGIVVAIVSSVAAYVLVGKIFDYFRAPSELKDWHSRTVAGIVIDSPGEFKTLSLNFGDAQKLIDKSDNVKCEASGFEIDVLRTGYKPGVELNLAGAVKGAVSSVGALEGVTNMKHTASATTVSGKPAQRLSMTGDRTLDGRNGVIHVEGLLILDGRTFYQVEAVYDSSNSNGGEYAERTLRSVKLAP